MEKTKIQSFTDLNAWKEAHKFVLQVYEASKCFPRDEIFALTSQIRRAVISITSNIAEGFSRNSSKEKVQFYCIALGSLTEAESQLLIAKDLGYISLESFNKIAGQAVQVQKILSGLLKSARSR